MTTLSQSTKLELIRAVVIDQYGKEVEKLNKELLITANAVALAMGKGLYEKLSEAVAAVDPQLDPHEVLRYTTTLRIEKSVKEQTPPPFLQVGAAIRASYERIFKIEPCIDVPPTCTPYGNRLYARLDEHPALGACIKRIQEKMKEIQAFTDDLIAIISSVRNTKKLVELTNIFTPFLDTSSRAEATQLVPAEVLLRVNERKSPKNPSKAAA